VGGPLVDDGEGVRVKDHQGKEVANEVFSQSRMPSESVSHGHWIALKFIDQNRTEGAVGCPSRWISVALIRLHWRRRHSPCMICSRRVVECGSFFGVDLSSGGQQVLYNHKVAILGRMPQWSGLVLLWLVGINSWISQQKGNHLLVANHTSKYKGGCSNLIHLIGINP